MAIISIHRPYPPVSIPTATPNRRFLSPDPKEATAATVISSTQYGVDVDLGADKPITSVFAGYTNLPAGWTAQITVRTAGNVTTDIETFVARSRVSGLVHVYAGLRSGAVTARYVFVRFNRPSNLADVAITVGTVAVGAQTLRPAWGQEWGAGRSIFDTGTADRLFGGGFGIDEGARVPGYSWTLGDLQPAEIDALYDLILQVGQTRSILVIEDDDNTAGLYERMHWGLFQKLDAYERLDPLNSKWALQIGDWA